MIRRPPRSTLDRSSAASDVYKRQALLAAYMDTAGIESLNILTPTVLPGLLIGAMLPFLFTALTMTAVSYTHLRAHETVLDLVCRLLLEKKNK